MYCSLIVFVIFVFYSSISLTKNFKTTLLFLSENNCSLSSLSSLNPRLNRFLIEIAIIATNWNSHLDITGSFL